MAQFKRYLAIATLLGVVSARTVPQNVRDFYNNIVHGTGCRETLGDGFASMKDGPENFLYCGNSTTNTIHIQSTTGDLTNMDVCCDGTRGGPSDDGRCDMDKSYLSATAFRSQITKYGVGVKDLNAQIHPYIVFGNSGDKPGWRTFAPEDHGVEPLSVMIAVCGDKMFYGIWGDTNGDEGKNARVGEASISLATACYGADKISAADGHDVDDVLFVAFRGKDALPGASGARWDAANFEEFEESIGHIGDELVKRL